jgi:hypothetical protein
MMNSFVKYTFSPETMKLEIFDEPSRIDENRYDSRGFRIRPHMHVILQLDLMKAFGAGFSISSAGLLTLSWGVNKNGEFNSLKINIGSLPIGEVQTLRKKIETTEIKSAQIRPGVLAIGYFCDSEKYGYPFLKFFRIDGVSRSGKIKDSVGICPVESWIARRYHDCLKKGKRFKFVPNYRSHQAIVKHEKNFDVLLEHLEARLETLDRAKKFVELHRGRLLEMTKDMFLLSSYLRYYIDFILGREAERGDEEREFEEKFEPGRIDSPLFTYAEFDRFRGMILKLQMQVKSQLGYLDLCQQEVSCDSDWNAEILALRKGGDDARNLYARDRIDPAVHHVKRICLMSGGLTQDLLRMFGPLDRFCGFESQKGKISVFQKWNFIMQMNFGYEKDTFVAEEDVGCEEEVKEFCEGVVGFAMNDGCEGRVFEELDAVFDYRELWPSWKRVEEGLSP